jgi:hypothetical protein
LNAYISYDKMLVGAEDAELNDIIEYLFDELPHVWTANYQDINNRITDIICISIGTFEYLFDDPVTFETNSIVDISVKAEARVVVAFGKSVQLKKKRDDYRLRGWLGPTNSFFGKEWDKGHYIAHCIGGAVDYAELNVFRQRRDLNRGWSDEGKKFRLMENYCFSNPGTFCFHRPIYRDQTHKPVLLEFGILTKEKKFWVERFNNEIK